MKKIVIGISPRNEQVDSSYFIRVNNQYLKQLDKDFIIPIILVPNTNFEEQLNMCDGFLDIGGNDIDPKYYGQSNDEGLSKCISEDLDTVDKQIIEHAIKYKKPYFGICRGLQVLAAMLGGTLYQDLESSNVSHPLLEEHLHNVTKVENFGVAKLLPEEFKVNSYHHQAIDKVPDHFKVLFKNDDTIEAIEHESLPIIAVQWHPERYITDESYIFFNYFFSKFNK